MKLGRRDSGRRVTRRDFSKLLAAGAAMAGAGLAAPAIAQARARVVVIGGGAGGATAAKYIAKDEPQVEVTMVNDSPTYTTCFFSNLYIAGLRSLQSLTHRYDLLTERHGVKLVIDRAVGVDLGARQVALAGGSTLPYDRLVMSPGIAFRAGAIEGYDAPAMEVMPHGYTGGYQSFLIRRRLEAMRPGGVFVVAPPPNPYRCPPGPYERASMAALLLSRINPTAKVMILDSKDSFSKQDLFQELWEKFYGANLEWTPAALTGGGVKRVDANAMTVTTGDGQTISVDAACIIPPQQAGVIVAGAGLADQSGWAPVDGANMRSTLDPSVWVIGDAANASPMPKSAFSANSQAHMCALAVRGDLFGRRMFPSRYRNTCWSFVNQHDAIKIGSSYRAEGDTIREVSTFKSEGQEPAQDRLDSALEANSWYAGVTADMFS